MVGRVCHRHGVYGDSFLSRSRVHQTCCTVPPVCLESTLPRPTHPMRNNRDCWPRHSIRSVRPSFRRRSCVRPGCRRRGSRGNRFRCGCAVPSHLHDREHGSCLTVKFLGDQFTELQCRTTRCVGFEAVMSFQNLDIDSARDIFQRFGDLVVSTSSSNSRPSTCLVPKQSGSILRPLTKMFSVHSLKPVVAMTAGILAVTQLATHASTASGSEKSITTCAKFGHRSRSER